MAVRKAITFLTSTRHGSPGSLCLCSMAVDLTCEQLVDYTLGIHAMIRRPCFVGRANTRRRTVCCWCRVSRDRSAGPEDLTSGPVAFSRPAPVHSCVGSQSAAPTIGSSSSVLVTGGPSNDEHTGWGLNFAALERQANVPPEEPDQNLGAAA